MKKQLRSILGLSIITLALFACNQDQIDQLSQEKDEFKQAAADKDSTITEMLTTFNQIQENLNEIKEREGLLQVTDPESDQQKIIEDIQTINQLMKENEEMREYLNDKLRKSQAKNQEFRKLVENLNRQIELKNEEIAKLNEILQRKDKRIGQLYFSVDSLNTEVKEREQNIKETKADLNTAYYAYGTFDELEEKNVITKEGGFLGLGKTESIKEDVNLEYFTKIDIREQQSFLIYAKEAELVSKHPDGSYKFVGEEKVDSLVITDPNAFWKASKLMVIVIKK